MPRNRKTVYMYITSGCVPLTNSVTARRWKPLRTLTVCMVAVSQMIIFGSAPT